MLSFDTQHLFECMDNLHKVYLSCDDSFDVFVGLGCFVQHTQVVSALDALSVIDVVLHCEQFLGCSTGMHSACTVAAAVKAVSIAQP